ncbi:MAG: DUF1080 domain-containing protein [Acidobacteria bacterium]|nr:DUF1080 domain-containing protein [Acidobacteriota bacterium]
MKTAVSTITALVVALLATLSGHATQPQWVSLFDGQTIAHWRGFKMATVPDGWRVEEGAITWTGGTPVDLVSREQYANFEFEFDWKLPPRGNSGIMFRVTEELDRTYHSGPEYQILHDAGHRDGNNPLTSVGANYAMHAPTRDASKPVGEWNTGRLVVNGTHVEHWLNGEKVVEYELHGPEWTALMLASKFKEWPRYGREARGHIALQEHGARVQYRHLRIKVLP